jgi:hypothetical protein
MKCIRRPGTVAQTCNLSYLGCGDWKDHGSRPAWTKKICKTPFQPMIGYSSTCLSSWATHQEAQIGGLWNRMLKCGSNAKITSIKSAGGMAQVVEYLPTKHQGHEGQSPVLPKIFFMYFNLK